jgi:hypothetical protein
MAQQARLQVAPEDAEGLVVSAGGGGKHRVEGKTDQGAVTLPVPAG